MATTKIMQYTENKTAGLAAELFRNNDNLYGARYIDTDAGENVSCRTWGTDESSKTRATNFYYTLKDYVKLG